MSSEESLSECSDSISYNNFSIYEGGSSLDSLQTSLETVIFPGKAYLKINLLVKTPLPEFMATPSGIEIKREHAPENVTWRLNEKKKQIEEY